jgi:hypothetical protein
LYSTTTIIINERGRGVGGGFWWIVELAVSSNDNIKV